MKPLSVLLCCAIFISSALCVNAGVILNDRELDFAGRANTPKNVLLKHGELKLLAGKGYDKVVKGLWAEEMFLAGIFAFVIVFEYGRKFSLNH